MKLKKLLSLFLILCMIVTLAACGSKASRDKDDDDEETVSSSRDKGFLFSKGSDDNDDKGKTEKDDDKGSGSLWGKDNKDDDDEDSGSLWGKDEIDDGYSDEDYSDDEDVYNSDIEDWSDPGDYVGDSSDRYEDYTDPYNSDESVELPDGFPSNLIPMYKDGTVYYVLSDTVDDVPYYYVLQNCNDSGDDVADYYKRELRGSDDFKAEGGFGFYSIEGEIRGYTFTIFIADDTNDEGKCIVSLEVRER